MTKRNTPKAPTGWVINIPFSGFYGSKWSDMIDQQETQEGEYMQERQTDATYHAETYEPCEALRVTDSEYGEILMARSDYSAAYRAIAQEFVPAYSDEASAVLGFDLGLVWEGMSSPREYNFETDQLFAYIKPKVARKLFALSKAEKHERLSAAIAERFTSRDGFISFYDNDLASWLAKPLADWDHNELGTLLVALVPDDDNEIEWSICGDWADSGYHQWSECVDWAKVESDLAELRADKVAELVEAGELELDHIPYRCPVTLDLFATPSGGLWA